MATQHTADAYDKYRQTIQPGQRALSRTKWSAQNAAPAAPATPTVLPDSTAPEGFNYGETLKNVAQEASKLNQQKQLDQRFEALGLGNLKGSQIDASFMGKLISGFKDAKDRGVLQHLGYEERKREAEQEAKTAATETAYKHFEDLGPILADVEPSKLQSMIAGSNIDYKTALLYQKKAEYDKKLSETKNEEEKVQLAKEMELMDLEIANAKKDLSGELTPKEQADLDYKLAQTDALLKETDDIYPNTADKSLTGVRPREDGGFNFGNPIAGRVECGMYRNDALGIIGSTGRMGDTFESKYKFASGKKPIEGGSFSMDYGQSGHCGLVEKVFPLAEGQIYPDILVADTNRGDKKDGVKKIDIIRPNDNGIYILPGTNNTPIAGFGKGIEPAKAATGDTSKPGQTHKDMAAKIGLTLPATKENIQH